MKLYISSLEGHYPYLSEKTIRKSKYILCSFAYIGPAIRNTTYFEKIMIDRNRENNLILDSGAFTFMNGNKKISLDDMDKYCDTYINFIKKYHIKNYVELDIDALFGTKQAMKYREKLENEIGYQCIPIWHKERGMQSFKQDVEKYDYIGIGGLAIKTIKRSDWEKLKLLTNYARKRHTKLHAMGFTPSHDVYKYGFYSSDSSSWSSSMRFGTVSHFDGRGISALKNVKYKRVKGDDYTRAFSAGYLEWVKYQAYVDNKNR